MYYESIKKIPVKSRAIDLMAHNWPVFTLTAFFTTPLLPFPITSSVWRFSALNIPWAFRGELLDPKYDEQNRGWLWLSVLFWWSGINCDSCCWFWTCFKPGFTS